MRAADRTTLWPVQPQRRKDARVHVRAECAPHYDSTDDPPSLRHASGVDATFNCTVSANGGIQISAAVRLSEYLLWPLACVPVTRWPARLHLPCRNTV